MRSRRQLPLVYIALVVVLGTKYARSRVPFFKLFILPREDDMKSLSFYRKKKNKCILVSEVCARANEGEHHIARGGYIKHTVEEMSFVSFV